MNLLKALVIVPALSVTITCVAQQKSHEAPAKGSQKADQSHQEMKVVTMDNMTWSPGPKTLPAGTEIMVLSGDPGKAGVYTMRIKFPAGHKVMPHWHTSDEHVTVLKGRMKIGMGDNFDEASMTESQVGGFIHLPAKMHHYAMAVEESIIQLHGMGPFSINYINPKDDPSKMSSK
jgi:hypothetical protein